MSDLLKAAQIALDALENTTFIGMSMEPEKRFYIAIIREALAQPEQEHVYSAEHNGENAKAPEDAL